MEFAIGAVLAIIAGVSCTILGMDRDRALYPAIMIVIAALYSLFAVMGGSTNALILEIVAGAVFVTMAVAGFKWSMWFVVAALAGHGVFDFVHDKIIHDPGVPTFWPAFCSAYDIVAAAYLGWLVASKRLPSSP